MKKIITIIIAITIFQIPIIFAQTYTLTKYIHLAEEVGLKPSGFADNTLLYMGESNQIYKLMGENPSEMINSPSIVSIKGEAAYFGTAYIAATMQLIDGSIVIENEIDYSGIISNLNNLIYGGNDYYYLTNNEEVYRFSDDGNHEFLGAVNLTADYLISFTHQGDDIVIVGYTDDYLAVEITKVPKSGGTATSFIVDDYSIHEVTGFCNSQGECLLYALRVPDGSDIYEIITINLDGSVTLIAELEKDGEQLQGAMRLAVCLDINGNPNIIITGNERYMEIVYEQETAINNLPNFQISVFPNPTNGIINIGYPLKVGQQLIINC